MEPRPNARLFWVVAVLSWGTGLFVPNFPEPQPQPYSLLNRGGRLLIDGGAITDGLEDPLQPCDP